MSKALLIIDLQNDFVRRGGALYFEGAEKVLPKVMELVDSYIENEFPIITTQDWHDENDDEFKKWPVHCVAGSDGARLVEPLEERLKNYHKHYAVKKTRFSAFYKTNFDGLIKRLRFEEFDVVGVVTHICVLFTVEELRNRGYSVKLHEKGVASYDEDMHHFALKLMKDVLGVDIL